MTALGSVFDYEWNWAYDCFDQAIIFWFQLDAGTPLLEEGVVLLLALLDHGRVVLFEPLGITLLGCTLQRKLLVDILPMTSLLPCVLVAEQALTGARGREGLVRQFPHNWRLLVLLLELTPSVTDQDFL